MELRDYKNFLLSVKGGFDLRTNIPYLKKAVREGLLDQEDVHLAIIEGQKNRCNCSLLLVRGGYDFHYHIPILREGIEKKFVDQEDVHLAIIAGNLAIKKRR